VEKPQEKTLTSPLAYIYTHIDNTYTDTDTLTLLKGHNLPGKVRTTPRFRCPQSVLAAAASASAYTLRRPANQAPGEAEVKE